MKMNIFIHHNLNTQNQIKKKTNNDINDAHKNPIWFAYDAELYNKSLNVKMLF